MEICGNFVGISPQSIGVTSQKICTCGDLDGGAPLIVAQRAPLVVALLALVSFLTSKARQRDRVLDTCEVLGFE